MCEGVELLFCEEEEVEHCGGEVWGWKAGFDVDDGCDGEAHLVDFGGEAGVAFLKLHGFCLR